MYIVVCSASWMFCNSQVTIQDGTLNAYKWCEIFPIISRVISPVYPYSFGHF